MAITWLLAALLVIVCAGCSTEDCHDRADSGLVVKVTDASSGAEICDATVRAENAADSEMLDRTTVCSYTGLLEKSGGYTVTVSHPDYSTKIIEVRIEKDVCGVITENVEVSLDKS